jgi:hypothetical protein
MMRIWTLHPACLDAKGLLALWRETLLAQKVLRGEVRGYRHHPQLTRFRASGDPLGYIGSYLQAVAAEATARGYRFDTGKIHTPCANGQLEETAGQLDFEWEHLCRKLAVRDPDRCARLRALSGPRPHPLFRVVPGGVQPWERVPAAATGTARGGT